jgi:hypothetical protein
MWSARAYVSAARTKGHDSEFSATMTPWTLQHCISACSALKKSLHKAARLKVIVKWRNRKGRPVVRPIGCRLLTAAAPYPRPGLPKYNFVKEPECVFMCALPCRRLRLKCDGTRAETEFRLSAKRTSPFKSAGGVSSVDYWQPTGAHQR